jgi:hypothetical protein
MGWWERWGPRLAALTLAGAAFVPYLCYRNDPRLKVEKHPPQPYVLVDGKQCVQNDRTWLTIKPQLAYSSAPCKVALSKEDVDAFEQMTGKSFKADDFFHSLVSPSGRHVAFPYGRMVDVGQYAEVRFTPLLLDRQTHHVSKMQSDGCPCEWVSSQHLQLENFAEGNDVTNLRKEVLDIQTGTVATLPSDIAFHCMTYGSMFAWLLLVLGAHATRRRFEESLPSRISSSTTERIIRPFILNLEEYVGFAGAIGFSTAAAVYTSTTRPLYAEAFSRGIPLLAGCGLIMAGIQKSLSEAARRPLIVHLPPLMYYYARQLYEGHNLTETTIKGMERHAAPRFAQQSRLQFEVRRGNYARGFELLDDTLRQRPQPMLLAQQLLHPIARVFVERVLPVRLTSGDVFDKVMSAVQCAQVGDHSRALSIWSTAVAAKDDMVPLLERQAALGRYVRTLESMVKNDLLLQHQVRRLAGHYKLQSDDKGLLVHHLRQEGDTLWTAVLNEVMREDSPVKKRILSTASNTVLILEGGYLLPHTLVIKQGDSLQREHDITAALEQVLPPMEVPRPLYFDRARGLLLLERVNGQRLDTVPAEQWSRQLGAILARFQSYGKNCAVQLDWYNHINRIESDIGPCLAKVGISIDSSYPKAVATLQSAPEGLLHGDCTLLNMMTSERFFGNRQLCFIDLEKVIRGPVAEDLGCLIAHYATPSFDVRGLIADHAAAHPHIGNANEQEHTNNVYITCLHEWLRHNVTALKWLSRKKVDETVTRERMHASAKRLEYVVQEPAFSNARDNYGSFTDFTLQVKERLARI